MTSGSTDYRETPASRLLMLLQGGTITMLLRLAVELGLPDKVTDEVRSEDLADEVGVSAQDLDRVLMALTSLGLFKRKENAAYSATGMSRLLRKDHPSSLAPMALYYGSSWRGAAMSALGEALKDGISAFEHRFERPLFEYLDEPGTARCEFDHAMTALSARDNLVVLRSLELRKYETLVDLGGGAGSLLGELLSRDPSLKGILVEREPVLEAARIRFEDLGVSDRVELFYGDFLSQKLPRGDTYLLKRIVHDWPDEAARVLLSRCREVAPANSRIVIIDTLLEPDDANLTRRLSDIEMLLLTGGRERSAADMQQLLETSGWGFQEVIRTGSFVDLTIGVASVPD